MTSLLERAGLVFSEICELPPERRVRALDSACGDDAELRAAVQELLDGDRVGYAFLEGLERPESSASGADAERSPEGVPARVRGFRVLGRLGAGGMGVVYEAEQEYPRRRVALKLLRTSLLTAEAERRFRREIEVLARLDHPGIARILEAGVTDEGAPFFSMELVRGLPLAEHTRSGKLDVDERVALVASACDAVQHAHDRGVVHRDLKPDNVLVGSDGQVKLLDFGIARVAQEEAGGGQTTMTGMVLGTLGAMSPEQAAGDKSRVDERTDVYGLGTLLYELMAGSPPIDVRGLPVHLALEKVRTEEPTRLAPRGVPGDLETIVLKALAKEPERRYSSAAAFGADLRRFLRHEPIVARPVTTLYKLAKFARRNRALVVSGAVIALALLAATLVSMHERDQALDARDQQALQAAVANLKSVDLALAAGRPVTARTSLAAVPVELRGWEWDYLSARMDQSLAALQLTAEPVALGLQTVDSEAGVVVLDREGGLSRWGLPDLAPLGTVNLSRGGILDADLRLDGRQVAVCFEEGTVGLFGAMGGELLASVEMNGARRVFLDPESRRVAIRVQGGGVHLWLPETGVVGEALRHEGAPADAAMRACELDFVPGAKTILRTTFWGGLGVADFNAETQEPPGFNQRFAKGVQLQVSADGTRVAAGWADRTIELLEVRGLRSLGTYSEIHAPITALALDRDGAALVCGTKDGAVRAWDTGRPGAPPEVFFGHDAPVVGVDADPTGDYLVSASSDGSVRVWSRGATAARVLTGHAAYVYPVAFASGGDRVLSASQDGEVRTWDVASGELLAAWSQGGAIFDLASSASGRLAAICGRDGVTLFDNVLGETEVLFEERWTTAVALHEEGGGTLAAITVGRMGSSLELWDLATRTRRMAHPLEGSAAIATALAFTGAGDRLFAAKGTQLLVLDVASGAKLAERECSSPVYSMAFCPGASVLATGHQDGHVRFRDASSLASRHGSRAHTGRVLALAFSPDATRLASGADDGEITLWDPDVAVPMLTLSGHESYVYSLAFSPDGRRLASGSGDATVRLWETIRRSEAWSGDR